MKLGGDAATITTYTIIINILVAIAIPLLLPIAHPQDNLPFLPAFLTIMAKVFPLLICPFIAACMVRYCLPRFHHLCLQFRELAFYLWAISLALAIAVTCKAIAHSHEPCLGITGIAIAALICCIFQFAIGKAIGGHFHHRLEGGQGLGQKNTVFIIWLGYTFLSPVTALAGGFGIVNCFKAFGEGQRFKACAVPEYAHSDSLNTLGQLHLRYAAAHKGKGCNLLDRGRDGDFFKIFTA